MSTPDQLHVVTVSSATHDIMHTILGKPGSFGDVNQTEQVSMMNWGEQTEGNAARATTSTAKPRKRTCNPIWL